MGRNARLIDGAFPLLEGDERIARHVVEPARRKQLVSLPAATSDAVREALGRAGITELYPFQDVAAQLLSSGRHVALAGGTGAGARRRARTAAPGNDEGPPGSGGPSLLVGRFRKVAHR